jgi:hypothetical protein
MKKVWIYVDTKKEVGDPDYVKAFADAEAAERWFKKNDRKAVAIGYDVLEMTDQELVFDALQKATLVAAAFKPGSRDPQKTLDALLLILQDKAFTEAAGRIVQAGGKFGIGEYMELRVVATKGKSQ